MQKRLEDLGWWLLLALGLWLCACLSASGQTQAFYANNVQDSTGAKLANGQVTVQPSSGSQPISYRFPGGGQGTMQVVAGNVVNGQFSLVLPDVAQTFPANVCFDVSVIDLSTNDTVLEDKCVQPSMTASYASNWCGSSYSGCDFDLFIPPIPGILPQNISGNVTYNYGSGEYVNVNSFPGADLGAQLAAADAAYTGQSKILAILTGGTIATQATLSANHGLAIYGPVTFKASITPTTGNTVQCYGGAAATITNGMSANAPNASGINAFFYAAPGAAEVEHFTVQDCTFNGYGAHGGYIFASAGPTQDVSIFNNDALLADLYYQGGATASNPTLRLKVQGNTCDWTASPSSAGQNTSECVQTYGAVQQWSIDHNIFTDAYYGTEMFANTGNGGAPSSVASLSDVQSSGLGHGIFGHNVCTGVVACGFWSIADRVVVDTNTSDGCGDTCYDAEASAHFSFTGNKGRADANGLLNSFFFAYEHTAVGNTLDDCSVFFHNFNASTQPSLVQAWDFKDNTYNCETGGIAFYFEQAQRMHLAHNSIRNGTVARTAYMSSEVWEDNDIYWTVPVPTAQPSGGSPGYGGGGLVMGNVQDGTYTHALRNRIYSTPTVSQSVPCIALATSNPNGGQTATIDGNICQGWTQGISISNSATNPQTFDQVNVRNNQLDSCSISVTGNYAITKFGNYVGSTGAACN